MKTYIVTYAEVVAYKVEVKAENPIEARKRYNMGAIKVREVEETEILDVQEIKEAA